MGRSDPRALFVTTETVDCVNHVHAWVSVFGDAIHWTYEHNGNNIRNIRNDWQALDIAQREKPDVIFYIGACDAPGNPTPDVLKDLNNIAPLINFCSDAADGPWHKEMVKYAKHSCFSLQVGIDGNSESCADFNTLTPVDARMFTSIGVSKRDIRCGFSGTVGRWNPRSEVILALKWFGGLVVRDRAGPGSYQDHLDFMGRCQMVVNVSNTGTGNRHHIKGRVLECGYAGCCLLESEGSPIGDWFPDDCYFLYKDPPEAAHLIATLQDDQIRYAAKRLAEEVRTKYTARHIFSQILDAVDVHYPNKVEAA